MKLDRHGARNLGGGVSRVVTVLAVWAVHMRRRRWLSRMAVCMRDRAEGTVFWFKSFVNRVDDEVHGAQQAGQHVVGLNL